MQKEFDGKIAIVSGGGGGIGGAIAKEWAAQGGTSIVLDINSETASATAEEICAAGGRAEAQAFDVRNSEEWRRCLASVERHYGRLDALFNVAGINTFKTIEEMEEAEWRAIFDTNLTAIFFACKLAIPLMRKTGGGSIVNISSLNGLMAANRIGAYSASKAGVILLTRNMAIDFAADGIRVNCICPGSTRSPRTERYWKNSPTGKSQIAFQSPMRRPAEPHEIARPAVFLASSGASYMTGSIVVVDGGLSAGLQNPGFEQR